MNIALISRDIGEKEISKELRKQIDNLIVRLNNYNIKAFIVAKFEKEDGKIKFIKSENPASSISMNLALDYIKTKKEFKPDAFFVWSKEVYFESEDVNKLANEIKNNENLLVVGYKFKHADDDANKVLNDNYENKNLIAYRVPWNTCAMWNYELFNKYAGKFDEITLGNYPFQNIPVIVNGTIRTTEHKGMEDGLAIAQAASKSMDIKFKLIEGIRLNWDIRDGKTEDHFKKLARKESVMRNFMVMRNYSVGDLENAEIVGGHN
jgi:hypothetical protein